MTWAVISNFKVTYFAYLVLKMPDKVVIIAPFSHTKKISSVRNNSYDLHVPVCNRFWGCQWQGKRQWAWLTLENKKEISIRCKSEITEQKVNFYKYIQIFFNTWLDDKKNNNNKKATKLPNFYFKLHQIITSSNQSLILKYVILLVSWESQYHKQFFFGRNIISICSICAMTWARCDC